MIIDGSKPYEDFVKAYNDVKDEDTLMAMPVEAAEFDRTIMRETTGINSSTKITTDMLGVLEAAGLTGYRVGDEIGMAGVIPLLEAGYSSPDDVQALMTMDSLLANGTSEDRDTAADFLRDSAGLTLRAVGQLASTFNAANYATNAIGLTDMDVENTWLGKAAAFLEQTGMDIHSDEYKAALKDYNDGYGNARKAVYDDAMQEYLEANQRPNMSVEQLNQVKVDAAKYAESESTGVMGAIKTIYGVSRTLPACLYRSFWFRS